MAAKQPSYYQKKYFDAKFHGIGEKVDSVKTEVKRINGNVVAVTKRLSAAENVSRTMIDKHLPNHLATIKKVGKMDKKVNGMEKRYLFVSGAAVTAGTFFGYVVSNFLK